MDEVLDLGLTSPFESRKAVHTACENAGCTSLRVGNASLLIFAVRGSLEIDWVHAPLSLDSNDALLVSCGHTVDLACRYTADTEWYALEYRLPHRRTPTPVFGAPATEQVHVMRPERVTDLMRRYVGEHARRRGSSTILSCILQLILAEVAYSREQPVDSQCDQGVFEVIASRVDAFIAAHYREPISTFDIAGGLRYNPDYLERVYHQERRMSIREAIQLRRIREARAQLLLQKNLAVSEIALMCGFNDTSFFRRAFKKATNMTPHRYRIARKGLPRDGEARAAAESRSGAPARPNRVRVSAGRAEPRRADARRMELKNPIDPLNGGFFVSPGYGTHARRVLDSYELIFVTHGHLELYEGDTEYRLGKNDALLLFPGRMHGGLHSFEPELTFYWVHFRIRDLQGRKAHVRVPKATRVCDPELLAELFCTFISDQESRSLNLDSASNLIALMLCAVAQGANKREPAGHRRPIRRDGRSLARLVDDYIDANYRRPISTAAIARALKFNPDYLERVYREYRDAPILRALHERRIQAAREYLRSGNSKNINEIALECGYNDPGYFRRMFKRVTGLTPKQYRSMFVQTHINAH